MKLVRCILIDTGMPQFLWGEICETTAYIINRCPHRALGGRSPYSQLYNRSSYLSSLHIIGVRAFVHNERHVHKLEQKAWGGLVIGYGKDSCSNRIYNPQTRRITESRNVTFMRHCPRHHHLLDKNNYSRRTRKLSRKKLITGTFLGIYRYLVHQTKIKTQQRHLWHHPLRLARRNVQLAQEVHQDHRGTKIAGTQFRGRTQFNRIIIRHAQRNAISTGAPLSQRTTAQLTNPLTRSLRSKGPERNANSGGFDARTLRELPRLGHYYKKPISDCAHEMEYASRVE